MSTPEVFVPVRYYLRLAEVLAREGIDLNAIFDGLKLSARALANPHATLPFSQVERLVTRVQAVTNRTDIGFQTGRLLTVSAHSFVGFGMLNCRNLDDALRFQAKYFRLLTPTFNMRYHTGVASSEIHLTPLLPMRHACLAFHIEAIGMAALRELEDLTGDRRPLCQLELSIPEPPHVQRYDELRNLRASFRPDILPGIRVRLAGDMRTHALAMPDANARQLAEERCDVLVRRMTKVHRFSDWVAMNLREVGDKFPSLTELAEVLGISTRTLNRYLGREGTSYRELSGRIRHEIACERLSDDAMSVSQVAYSLGFDDLSNFGRAFRTRAGCSPSAFRRRATGSRVDGLGA